jgi:L-histidine N-alpha-methyltransferase
MPNDYRILDPAKLGKLRSSSQEFALAVLEGLSELPKRLPSRYFYDDRGSELFREITQVEDYYPTRCEREILETHADAIIGPVANRRLNLVDLGAGDGSKTVILLEHLKRRGADVCYVPIDISEEAMRSVVNVTRQRLPEQRVGGLVAEYTDGLRWLRHQDDERTNLVLFLGSNIGNFPKVQARGFLRRLWCGLGTGDHVLIGFDLKKDIEILLRAYNDREGLTRAFNLNLLDRINRELGANFDPSKFRHYGTYDVHLGAMTSYLVSLEHQAVQIDALEHEFEFDAWEAVHTEYSYKYLESDIDGLAEYTGFSIVDRFYDKKRFFTDSLWRAEGSNRIPGASTRPV